MKWQNRPEQCLTDVNKFVTSIKRLESHLQLNSACFSLTVDSDWSRSMANNCTQTDKEKHM